jgi:hypothetical protein
MIPRFHRAVRPTNARLALGFGRETSEQRKAPAGSYKRPDLPGVGARRAETCHNAPSPEPRRDQLINAADWTLGSVPADGQRIKESPGRVGAFNNLQEKPRGKGGT